MQIMDTGGHDPAQTTGEADAAVRKPPGEGLVGAGELGMRIDETLRHDEEGSGWTSTKQAAKALGVSRRMVQEYVRRGALEAFAEGEGVSKTYYVSIDSLNALRGRRGATTNPASGHHDAAPASSAASNQAANPQANPTKGAPDRGEVGEVLRHVVERLEARTVEAAELKVRLELTTQAESSLRESLERERMRVALERERADRLEAELLATRREAPEPRDGLETALGGADRGDDVDVLSAPQEQPTQRRSWLYRFFFGE